MHTYYLLFRASNILVCNMHPTVSVEMNMTNMATLITAIWRAKEMEANCVVEVGQTKSTELVRHDFCF